MIIGFCVLAIFPKIYAYNIFRCQNLFTVVAYFQITHLYLRKIFLYYRFTTHTASYDIYSEIIEQVFDLLAVIKIIREVANIIFKITIRTFHYIPPLFLYALYFKIKMKITKPIKIISSLILFPFLSNVVQIISNLISNFISNSNSLFAILLLFYL